MTNAGRLPAGLRRRAGQTLRVLGGARRGQRRTWTSSRSGPAGAGRQDARRAPHADRRPAAGGGPGPAAPALAKKPVRWMVAIMSGSHRRGRFRAVGSINAISIMGGDEIDLREAEIEGGELTLNLVAVMGGAEIYIPDSIELDVGGFSLMGGNTEIGSERPPRPGAPVIQLRAWNLMGGARFSGSRRRPAAWAWRKRVGWPAAGRGRCPPVNAGRSAVPLQHIRR